MLLQKKITVATPGRSIIDITPHVKRFVSGGSVQIGLCNIYIHHTSASLFINENADRVVRDDLERFMSRLVRDGDPIFKHVDEGVDDMSAHVRSVLTATSLNIPITKGRCALGTWQGVFLWEHRAANHSRSITMTLLGE